MLTFETTHEYYMKDPTMYYCAEHDGLCLSEDFEDTVRFTGVEKETIIKFVSGLFKQNADLAASLK